MATKRAIIEQLSRDELWAVVDQYGLTVADRRKVDLLVEAVVKAKKVAAREVLDGLKIDRLREIARAVGVDDGGREKAVLAARIAGDNGGDGGPTGGGNGHGGTSNGGAAGRAGGDGDEGAGFSLTAPTGKDGKPRKVTKRSPPPTEGVAGGASAEDVSTYKHDETRPNNPPVGLGDFDRPPPQPKKTYAYDPHLDPTLQWAGKAERTSFEVETVSLHIHEHVSTEAIVRAVKREPAQRDLFARIELPAGKEVDFYKHEVDWKNRLILGDSLVVMNSLLEREHMAGKVQCIYMDPPYGVKFNSNFQPFVHKRDVKDGDDASLTREPEQIQAYRDTWELGVHSYLSYLRDRLLLARELLAESGSVFVQISDENIHRVRSILDEVFGSDNFIAVITVSKTSGLSSPTAKTLTLATTADFVLWYGKNAAEAKYRQLFRPKANSKSRDEVYRHVELADGSRRALTPEEMERGRPNDPSARTYTLSDLSAQKPTTVFEYKYAGRTFHPGKRGWRTTREGFDRLALCRRLHVGGDTLRFVQFEDDFPVVKLTSLWEDTGTGSFLEEKTYVVQTGTKTIERCVLMTTDPGDLVLDPTCGSGTTAYVAEQWGRRWITCDTSRVALALARQRILTARFPYYRLRTPGRVRDGFLYRTVPHITLKSIAQNERLDACKTQEERERVIRDSAEQETLYDQPEQLADKVRVAGPFTVEAIPVASLGDATATASEDGSTDEGGKLETSTDAIPVGAEGDFIGWLIDKVRATGVYFPNGKHVPLATIRPVRGPSEWLHAEAEMGQNGGTKRVAVSFAPRSAPVTPHQVREALSATYGFQVVLFVGFALDPEAGKMITQGIHGRELFFANAAPDLLVGDLLKTKKTTRLFSVFGQPEVRTHTEPDGMVSVEVLGIDLYDPHTGTTSHDTGDNVAAWFVDHDYDGKTFCICQALFPARGMKNPWDKLQKALKGSIDEDKFEQLRKTRSLPFKPGKRVAVKVIDARGNEVIQLVEMGKGKGRSAS